jgi:hypothetical protein
VTDEAHKPQSENSNGVEAKDDFGKTLVGIFIGICLLAGKAQEFLKSIEVPLMAIALKFHQAAELEKVGWLPHPDFPFDRFDDALQNPVALKEALAQYHSDSWPDIRKALEANIASRRIDEDARNLFRQALDAHGMGFYALVPRSLFPELERIWRAKFSEEPTSKTTSHPGLMRALKGQLDLMDAVPGEFFPGMTLLGKLLDHVFKTVTSDNHAEISADLVPNRHAAQHGYCVYDNAQSSLNALIMADYMLHLFDQLDSPEFRDIAVSATQEAQLSLDASTA